MPTFKTTFMIECLGAGWTESWYSDDTGLLDARVKAEVYGQARRVVLSTGSPTVDPAAIIGYRIQQVDEPLNYTVERVNWPGTFKGDNPEGPDQPWTGVLCSILSLGGRRRPFLLRGVDDSGIVGSYKSVNFSAALQKALDSWKDGLIASGYGVYSLDKGGGNPLHDIGTLVPAVGGLTLTTALPHGLVTGDRIRFESVVSSPSITGTHPVVKVDADTVTVRGFNLGTLFFQSGQFRKDAKTISDIVNVLFVRKGSRKAGRPFFLLRGRR